MQLQFTGTVSPVLLTLIPAAPSLPGGPSDPGLPCQMTQQYQVLIASISTEPDVLLNTDQLHNEPRANQCINDREKTMQMYT